MRSFLRCAPLALSLVAGCAGTDPVRTPPPDAILTDVTVIDGSGAPPKPAQTIEITDGRITAIRPTASEDSATLDVAGSFVTPGLIDSHVHLPSDSAQLRARLDSMLRIGITSAREMACCAPAFSQLLSGSDSSRLTRLYWSAFWAGPPFMRDDRRLREIYAEADHVPWLLAVSDTTDIQSELRGARASGATGLKVYSDLETSLMTAIVESARDAGMRVWSHAVIFPTKPSVVAASGVEVISHAAFFVWEGAEQLPSTYNGDHEWNPFGPPAPYGTVSPEDPAVEAVLETMRERGVILDPTITVMRYLSEESQAWAVELTRLAHALGVPIATGTDSALLFDEIEALVHRVGMSPLEAIASATSVGAAAIGVEEEFGSVHIGKVADLVVYPADPSADITALRRPSHVIRGGRLVQPRS